jgi:hypothetical protein
LAVIAATTVEIPGFRNKRGELIVLMERDA